MSAALDRYTWLQGMISNDDTLLTSGSATRLPACVLDATGHLLFVVTLTTPRDLTNSILMEVTAANRHSLHDTLDRYLITEDVEITLTDAATDSTSRARGRGSGRR